MARETREAWTRRVERCQRSGPTAERSAVREDVDARPLVFSKWKCKREGGRDRGPEQRGGREAGQGRTVAFLEFLSPAPAPVSASDARPAVFEVALAGQRALGAKPERKGGAPPGIGSAA